MDIIKRLQLNTNPKDLKSGSIVGAKNIMLDSISSSIINEYGVDIFKSFDYSSYDSNYIKGVIPLNNGLCIFTSSEIGEGTITVKYEDNSEEQIRDCWKWEGGDKVIGTYTYNYKGELILAVSEISNDENLHIPLKTINFTKNSCLNLEAPLPSFIPSYNISQEGFLVCGSYTFFIRYKLDEDTYSKWIQLTDDIIIIDSLEKEKPVQYYDKNNPSDYGFINTNDFINLYYNNNGKSNRNINLNITIFNNTENYKECQIGYIIKRDSETLGRLLGDYNIINTENLTINFDDNRFIEEININDFIEDPHQFYNVKNLSNYNNRLYISNYSEYKKYNYNDLSDLLNSIIPQFKHIPILDNNQTYKWHLRLDGGQDYIDKISDNQTTYMINEQVISLFKSSNFYNYINGEFIRVLDRLNVGSSLYPEQDQKYYNLRNAQLVISDNNYTNFISILNIDNTRPFTTNFDDIVTWDHGFYIELENSDTLYLKRQNNNGLVRINLANAKWQLSCNTYPDSTDANRVYSRSSKKILDDYYGIRPVGDPVATQYYDFTITDIKIIDDFRKIGTEYNNNRTLIPRQFYNFYIHFVRPDMSFTDGYKINKRSNFNEEYSVVHTNWTDFPTKEIDGEVYYFVPAIKDLSNSGYDANTGILTVPKFSVNTDRLKEKGFIGFVISYEKVERNIINVVPIGHSEEEGKTYIHYTNTELLYNSDNLNGKQLETSTSIWNGIGSQNRTKNKIRNKINNLLPYNCKYVKITFEKDVLPLTPTPGGGDENIRWTAANRHALYFEDNLYKSKVKTLYQLTPIAFIKNFRETLTSTDESNCYMYLPGFFNNEKVITYSKDVIISPVQTKIYDKNGQQLTDGYAIGTYTYGNYSQIPLNAFSIKQDYEKGAVTINNKVYSNSILSPANLSDFLEIKPAYTALPIKSYTNYQESTIDKFNKTIYRSDVISDESLNNGFRHFAIENYKNILENKGNITNIVGIGLYLLVHTEYSLFVFDRSNQLTDNAQLQIPDTFDIDYQEVIPSAQGYGGLRDRDESIVTKHGYIWYDYLSSNIYMYDGKQLKLLSADINILLKTFDNNQIRFAEDVKSNRLIICTINSNKEYITLSYSFDTNTFISLHDYKFDSSCITANNCYLWLYKSKNHNIYTFDKNSITYLDLKSLNSKYESISFNNKECSYVDIIFNDLYESPKQLNSLKYILGRNNRFDYSSIFDNTFKLNYPNFIKDNQAENNIDLYSGFRLLIISDLCYSGILDISRHDVINNINSDKPYWNNGIWNFNNFRNKINKDNINAENNPVTNEELALIETVNYYNSETGKNELKKVDLNELKEVYSNGNNGYTESDMRSVIVGKYFIFRFIFKRTEADKYNKFETLDVNISKI